MAKKFIYSPDEAHQKVSATTNVEVAVHDDASLDDMIEAFESFLKACGYHYDGHIEIIEEVEI